MILYNLRKVQSQKSTEQQVLRQGETDKTLIIFELMHSPQNTIVYFNNKTRLKKV